MRQKKPPRRQIDNDEAVRLFFAALPGVSDEQVAKVSGVPEDLVWSFRDPKSRIPYKRALLRSIVNRHDRSDLIRYFFPQVTYPQGLVCGSCGAHMTRFGYDRNRNPRYRCRTCNRTKTARPIHAKPLKALDKKSLEIFLDCVAAGFALRTCWERAGMCKVLHERLAYLLLTEWGGHKREDWRIDSRSKRARKGSVL